MNEGVMGSKTTECVGGEVTVGVRGNKEHGTGDSVGVWDGKVSDVVSNGFTGV